MTLMWHCFDGCKTTPHDNVVFSQLLWMIHYPRCWNIHNQVRWKLQLKKQTGIQLFLFYHTRITLWTYHKDQLCQNQANVAGILSELASCCQNCTSWITSMIPEMGQNYNQPNSRSGLCEFTNSGTVLTRGLLKFCLLIFVLGIFRLL